MFNTRVEQLFIEHFLKILYNKHFLICHFGLQWKLYSMNNFGFFKQIYSQLNNTTHFKNEVLQIHFNY